ncbi:MAG: DUF2029 domain-containing protein, partial [Acidimicrobiales bacterium]|nr:DUF2029 domain-containing protein [Acidimicrobiales bacterium]
HDRVLGYPVVLVLTGSSETPTPLLLGVQLALYVATAWMVLALFQRFDPPKQWSYALLVLLASPPLVEKVYVAQTETLSGFLVTMSVTAFVLWLERQSTRWAVLSGVSIALAAITHPVYQGLALLVPLAYGAWRLKKNGPRQAFKTAGAFVVGPLLILGALVGHNWVKFDYPGVTPMLGWHLSTKTALFIDELPMDEPARAPLMQVRDQQLVEGESHTALTYFWQARYLVEPELGLQRPESDNYMLKLNLKLIARTPLGYANAVGNSFVSYSMPSAGSLATGDSAILQLLMTLAHFGVALVFACQAIAVAGMGIARRLGSEPDGPFSDRRAISTYLAALGLIAYTFTVTVLVETGIARHRSPIDPLILLVTFAGAWMAWTALGPNSKATQNPLEPNV